MEEKQNEIHRSFSRWVMKFSALMFIPELAGVALMLIGSRRTDSSRMVFLFAALAVLTVTMAVYYIALRKRAKQRDEELRELEQKYRPLEDWMDGDKDA